MTDEMEIEIDEEYREKHNKIDFTTDYPNEYEVNGHLYKWISSPLNAKKTSWRVDVVRHFQGEWHGLHKDYDGRTYDVKSPESKKQHEKELVGYCIKGIEIKCAQQVSNNVS